LCDFFSERKTTRIQKGLDHASTHTETAIASGTAGTLAETPPLLATPNISLQEAARLMTEQRESALLLVHNRSLVGIITDRDFREKAVAQGIDLSAPVAQIMTPEPVTATPETPATDALLLMLEHNIQHLPVTHGQQIVGILSASELLNLQSLNAISLASRISRAQSASDLAGLGHSLPAMMSNLVQRGLRAHDVANAASLIGETIFRRAVELVSQDIGPAPCAYAFVSYGSLARRDQTAHSDQDNGLILANEYHPEDHAYFEELAVKTSDILNACGYVYCPGNVMASNPKWRQSLDQWKDSFNHWINTPEPKALMYASIFFDMRHMSGDPDLTTSLAKHVREKAVEQSLFLSLMMKNA
ncbi:MAG: DUF294 nucleotidyltransferase-like domain-containing protein, partial [bacterium]